MHNYRRLLLFVSELPCCWRGLQLQWRGRRVSMSEQPPTTFSSYSYPGRLPVDGWPLGWRPRGRLCKHLALLALAEVYVALQHLSILLYSQLLQSDRSAASTLYADSVTAGTTNMLLDVSDSTHTKLSHHTDNPRYEKRH